MTETLQILVTSILLGAFIGFQREKAIRLHGYYDFAGLRTCTFICLLGSLATILSRESVYILPLMLLFFGALLISNYLYGAFRQKRSGATGEFVLMTLFLVGVLNALGDVFLSVLLVIFIGFTESLKSRLHLLTDVFSEEEFLDTLKFATIAFVILPLLPNYAIDPFGVLNPYLIWLMVVFISGIGFLAYIGSKFVGPKKGIALAGFFGGLISSTAATTTMALANREKQKIVNPFAFAILLATVMMLVRVLVEVIVLGPQLFNSLLVPFVVMAVVSVFLMWYFWSFDGKGVKSQMHVEDIGFKSPFTLVPALKFAVFFVLVIVAVDVLLTRFGQEGVYLTALISGFVDVDAITLSLSTLTREGNLTSDVAAKGIMLAVMTNIFVKVFYVWFFGGRKLASRLFISFLLVLGSGMITLLIL